MRVISLGGSLISPNPGEINTRLIKRLRDLIKKLDEKFIIVCGGGKISRVYQASAKKFNVSKKQLDFIGIAATRLNAELIKGIMGGKIISLEKKEKFGKIAISCGFEPGHSTDYDSVVLAKIYGCKEVINLTNIDYVYEKDPSKINVKKKEKKEKLRKIERISFDDYLKIVGKKWIPGKNVPFDPIATQLAKKYDIKIVIMNGRKIKNLKNYLEGKKFIGTLIG
ncbi:MAG: UMP kinase [Candidatus Micrarchaeia archaeon]